MANLALNCPRRGRFASPLQLSFEPILLAAHLLTQLNYDDNNPEDGGSEEIEDDFISILKPVVLGYKELGGLSDLEPHDCSHDVEYSRIRDEPCLIPYIYCNVLGYEYDWSVELLN
jgi:hypothetical protein